MRLLVSLVFREYGPFFLMEEGASCLASSYEEWRMELDREEIYIESLIREMTSIIISTGLGTGMR